MVRAVLFAGALVIVTGVIAAEAAQSPAAPPATTPAPAASEGEPKTPEEQIKALDQALRILERKLELAKEQAAERAAQAPIVSAGRDGFSIRSADGAHLVRFRGYLHVDGRAYLDDVNETGLDTFLLRRVRPVFEATTFRIFDFRVMPDFGGGATVLQDAYIDMRFSRAASLRAGKFKAPGGLERLASSTELLFIERAFPTAIAPNRDVGVMLHGDVARTRVSYAVGVFNGVVDGGSGDVDDRDAKDVAARVFVHPFRGTKGRLEQLGVGVSGGLGSQQGTIASPALTTLRSLGQQAWFRYRSDGTAAGTALADGDRQRVAAHGYYYVGRLGLIAEHALSSQEVRRETLVEAIGSRAWQVAGSWVLTGETPSFRGVSPRQNFDASKGTLGAFEIAARVTGLSVDGAAFPVFANPANAARSAIGWSIGTNWYLNRFVKIVVNYDQTQYDGGAATGDRPAERELFTRFQFSF